MYMCLMYQVLVKNSHSYMYYIVVSWVAMRKILYDIDILIQYFYNLKFLWGAHAIIIFFHMFRTSFVS
jgi:hypothetical protein